jgi:hypothetical protein
MAMASMFPHRTLTNNKFSQCIRDMIQKFSNTQVMGKNCSTKVVQSSMEAPIKQP